MNNLLRQTSQTVYAPGGKSGVSGAKSADGGNLALAQNAVTAAITFNAAFTAAPAVNGKIMSPTGVTEIAAKVDYSTLTAVGVTFRFSAIPTAGYWLSWEAVGN